MKCTFWQGRLGKGIQRGRLDHSRRDQLQQRMEVVPKYTPPGLERPRHHQFRPATCRFLPLAPSAAFVASSFLTSGAPGGLRTVELTAPSMIGDSGPGPGMGMAALTPKKYPDRPTPSPSAEGNQAPPSAGAPVTSPSYSRDGDKPARGPSQVASGGG